MGTCYTYLRLCVLCPYLYSRELRGARVFVSELQSTLQRNVVLCLNGYSQPCEDKANKLLEVMDEKFCVVPFWGVPSPETDNLLLDCFIGYDDNSVAKTTRYPSTGSKLSSVHVVGKNLEDVFESGFSSAIVQNDGERFPSSCESDSGTSEYDDSDISWLDEFMNVYGITTLDSGHDFSMKSIDVTAVASQESVTLSSLVQNNASTKPADVCIDTDPNIFSLREPVTVRKTINSLVLDKDNEKRTSESPFSKDISINVCTTTNPTVSSVHETSLLQNIDVATVLAHLSEIKTLCSSVCEKGITIFQSGNGHKFTALKSCFGSVSERKREQNRCAAIRYRGKLREEAKRKKQELRELELRNVELKTEMSWLEKEVAYLKSLMKLTMRL
uniref:BZIP domain-containing protein n=1 Tax=Setaria digitata TaxID=48799 RepID=A0A915PRZ7_9BILA